MQEQIIKIAIIDDNIALLENLQNDLEKEPSIAIVFTATHGVACLNYLASFKIEALPEIILMDISMPKMNGIEVTKQISSLYPPIQVIMLTNSDEDEQIFASIQAGAKGYLLKTEDATHIFDAIKEVKAGGTRITPSIARKIFTFVQNKPITQKEKKQEIKSEGEGISLSLLTMREYEILNLLSEGLGYQHIADKLFISVNTIKTHIYHIYEKLEVSNKMQAINKMKQS